MPRLAAIVPLQEGTPGIAEAPWKDVLCAPSMYAEPCVFCKHCTRLLELNLLSSHGSQKTLLTLLKPEICMMGARSALVAVFSKVYYYAFKSLMCLSAFNQPLTASHYSSDDCFVNSSCRALIRRYCKCTVNCQEVCYVLETGFPFLPIVPFPLPAANGCMWQPTQQSNNSLPASASLPGTQAAWTLISSTQRHPWWQSWMLMVMIVNVVIASQVVYGVNYWKLGLSGFAYDVQNLPQAVQGFGGEWSRGGKSHV